MQRRSRNNCEATAALFSKFVFENERPDVVNSVSVLCTGGVCSVCVCGGYACGTPDRINGCNVKRSVMSVCSSVHPSVRLYLIQLRLWTDVGRYKGTGAKDKAASSPGESDERGADV